MATILCVILWAATSTKSIPTSKSSATSLGYTVVNVADAFNAYTGTEPLVGFNMAATPATYDPHPTDAGHRMIYDLLVAASTTVRETASIILSD
jgi:hypothetical protein